MAKYLLKTSNNILIDFAFLAFVERARSGWRLTRTIYTDHDKIKAPSNKIKRFIHPSHFDKCLYMNFEVKSYIASLKYSISLSLKSSCMVLLSGAGLLVSLNCIDVGLKAKEWKLQGAGLQVSLNCIDVAQKAKDWKTQGAGLQVSSVS